MPLPYSFRLLQCFGLPKDAFGQFGVQGLKIAALTDEFAQTGIGLIAATFLSVPFLGYFVQLQAADEFVPAA